MLPEKLMVEIIKEQSLIIGEGLAKRRAEDAGVLRFNSTKLEDITISSVTPSVAIEKLVKAYGELFGRASIEVCIEVIKRYPIAEIKPFLPDSIMATL